MGQYLAFCTGYFVAQSSAKYAYSTVCSLKTRIDADTNDEKSIANGKINEERMICTNDAPLQRLRKMRRSGKEGRKMAKARFSKKSAIFKGRVL